MIFAGVVIETAPGAAPRVAARLLRERGLELHGGDGDRRLAAVFTGADAGALDALSERLVREDGEVLGVFPTYVADEPDDEETRASATESLRARGRGGGGDG
jgi:hypothetical protein